MTEIERIIEFCRSEQIDQSHSPQNDEHFESWIAGYDAAIEHVLNFALKARDETK